MANNTKAYDMKSGQERFYDFTIKDKDGVEMKSYKFLLASKSEYFAALFRRDPTASETTFKDFSLDAIKKSIDYLYIHEIDLTDNNVQDVLMFADYINLTSVCEICTNYIIKNIDQSNYLHVIDLGNTRGMVNLVEAGVFFAARNVSRQDIICLDEFSKAMIIKVAAWQQKRVTVMTEEQWLVNRLISFLSTQEETIFQPARSSSVYCCKSSYWGPRLAINGDISLLDVYYFHSQLEQHPWLEVRLPSSVLISSVTIVNRLNILGRLRKVEVRAGMEPVPEGFTALERGLNASKKLEVNSRCGHFAGPARGRFNMEGHVIMFDQPTLAQYITLQILDFEFLQINGIKINGGDLLNYEDFSDLM